VEFTVVLPSLLYFTEYKLQGFVTMTLIEGKAYSFPVTQACMWWPKYFSGISMYLLSM